MKLDDDQLEWIVREVVRRLQLLGPSPPGGVEPGEGGAELSPPALAAHLTLTQTLVTTATLENKLNNIKQVSVPQQAVITPAARDMLKAQNIELLRNASN